MWDADGVWGEGLQHAWVVLWLVAMLLLVLGLPVVWFWGVRKYGCQCLWCYWLGDDDGGGAGGGLEECASATFEYYCRAMMRRLAGADVQFYLYKFLCT
jgi:hypothetical protein